MKKRLSVFAARCLAVALAVSLVLGAFCIGTVSAAPTSEATRMNVMLVIDGSGSLTNKKTATDPDGHRYDAIDLFLALLTENGNNVGAVVFNGESDNFPLETGVAALDGKKAKQSLSKQIQDAGTGGYTDIGNALLKGVTAVKQAHEQNGLPSAVILFSDGKTEVKTDMEASLKAKEDAIVMAQNNDIPVYTICLAANDSADPNEMQEIAERCSGQFVKVEDSSALTQGFETFYKMIFGSSGAVIQEATFPDDGVLNFEFNIPSYGAEEMNIILDARELKETMITTPNGPLSADQVETYTMSGGFYDVVKLVHPVPGNWSIQLKGLPEKSATVNVLFNIDSSAALTSRENKTDYKVGETATFCANLIRNGKVVEDASVTSEYTAILTLTDNASGETKEYGMMPDSNGDFVYSLQTQDYTSYTASARLFCGNLEFSTETVSVNFGNTSPVASQTDLEVKKLVWPIFGRKYAADISGYFSDAQDTDLTYSIVSSQLVKDTYTLDSQTGELNVNVGASRSGTLVVQAMDRQGATAQMNVNFHITDLTYWVSGTLLIIVLVAIVLIASVVIAMMNLPWRGEITVRNLQTGVERTMGDFRGKILLKKFMIGACGVDGKFKALARNQLAFETKKPVFTSKPGGDKNATKQVTLPNGTFNIYADEAKNRGFAVTVNSRGVRGGGFGSMDSSRRTPKSTRPGGFDGMGGGNGFNGAPGKTPKSGGFGRPSKKTPPKGPGSMNNPFG